MTTPFRLMLVAVILLLMAGAAAVLQLKAHQRFKETVASLPASTALRATVADIHTTHQRAFIALLTVGLIAVVTVACVPARASGESPKLEAQRAEINQLDQLARTTLVQADQLAKERDARVHTEEALYLKQMRLNEALEEKIRLGRNLHDGIIQSLYATGLTLEAARQKRATQPVEAGELEAKGIELLNTTIREVRGYIEGLEKTVVPAPSRNFSGDLSAVFNSLRSQRSTTLSVNLDEAAEGALNPSQKDELVQIVREAISNALRHGDAGHISLRLHENGQQLALLIQDDGRGFDPARGSGTGRGLANLHARARTLGGELQVTSQLGQGTRLLFVFTRDTTV